MKFSDFSLTAAIHSLGLEPIIANNHVILLAPLAEFWQSFQASAFSSDENPDPLDRYSKAKIQPLAEGFALEAAYPSDGPPYPPFITWAKAAPHIKISPIGLLVHKDFGLWISFRGALIGEHGLVVPQDMNPCQNCPAPCLSACPIGAFENGQYNVQSCQNAIAEKTVPCLTGCLARQSCLANHYPREKSQSEFHMQAFMS